MVVSENKAKRSVGSQQVDLTGLGVGGSKWVMELRIERASLPPVWQLCSPDFGSVGLMPAEGLLDPV